MKIAIFHDYFGSIGGGEKLVLELGDSLNADIYTTEINRKNLQRINVNHARVKLLKDCIKFPILKQIHSSMIFSNADLRGKGYDFYIMSGNWSIFACKKHHPNLHYVHTPPRMFYDGFKEFYSIAPFYAKIPFLLWVKIHRYFYEKQTSRVDEYIANSINVQKKIKRYYHKDSQIIFPPVKYYKFKKYGDYWLSVNRTYPHKRVELQVEAFRQMPDEKLIIVGGYMTGDHAKGYASKVLENLPMNVNYLREVDEKTLGKLYGECKAFITTSRDEDFGMTPLEVMGAGKPVVATNEGGYKETITNGKTGLLVNADINEIVDAVRKISRNPSKYGKRCIQNARKYSSKIFTQSMIDAIKNQLQKNR